MLGLSAVAVDKEIVGRDSGAERMARCCDGEEVDCGSGFDLGDVEKRRENRLGLEVDKPPFPAEDDEKDGEFDEDGL